MAIHPCARPARLEQEPRASFSLVDPDVDRPCGRDARQDLMGWIEDVSRYRGHAGALRRSEFERADGSIAHAVNLPLGAVLQKAFSSIFLPFRPLYR